MELSASIIVAIVISVVNIAAIGVAWGKAASKINSNDEKICKLERKLFNSSGLPIYLSVREAENMEARIHENTCAKIDELRKAIDTYRQEVQEDRRQTNKYITKLFSLVPKGSSSNSD